MGEKRLKHQKQEAAHWAMYVRISLAGNKNLLQITIIVKLGYLQPILNQHLRDLQLRSSHLCREPKNMRPE